MIVFVILRSIPYDTTELLGIRIKKEDAMKYAEEQEPKRTLSWIHESEDNVHADVFGVGKDPIFTYYVERHDVL